MYHPSPDQSDHRKQPVDRDLRRIARLFAKHAREAEADDREADDEIDPIDRLAEAEGRDRLSWTDEEILVLIPAALAQALPFDYAERQTVDGQTYRPLPARPADRFARQDDLAVFCARAEVGDSLRHPQDIEHGKAGTDAIAGTPVKNFRNGVPDLFVPEPEPEPEEEVDEWAQIVLADRMAMLASRQPYKSSKPG